MSADTEDQKGGQENGRRCSGRKADGGPCAVVPELLTQDQEGRWWCYNHDPDRSAAERYASRARGGLRAQRGKRKGLLPGEVGQLRTLEDAERIAARIAIATATGELSATQARATLAALKEWRAVVADGKILDRVKQLEAALAKKGRK